MNRFKSVNSVELIGIQVCLWSTDALWPTEGPLWLMVGPSDRRTIPLTDGQLPWSDRRRSFDYCFFSLTDSKSLGFALWVTQRPCGHLALWKWRAGAKSETFKKIWWLAERPPCRIKSFGENIPILHGGATTLPSWWQACRRAPLLRPISITYVVLIGSTVEGHQDRTERFLWTFLALNPTFSILIVK